jgi:hypothetical protein
MKNSVHGVGGGSKKKEQLANMVRAQLLAKYFSYNLYQSLA